MTRKTMIGWTLAGVSAAMLVAGPAAADVKRTRKPVKAVTPAPAPAPVTPPAPVIPPERLDLRPTVPPQVAYANGQLTVTAQNSTLGDVLAAIHGKTGATIEVSGPATDRVAIRIGPAPVREVLTALLDGSRFNYIILGTAGNPQSAERVILTPKSGGGGPPVAVSQPVYQPPQPAAQAPPPGRPAQFQPGQPGVPGIVRNQGGIGSPVPPAAENTEEQNAEETPDATGEEEPAQEQPADAEPDAAQDQPQPDPEPDPSPGEQDQNQQQRNPDGTAPQQPQAPQGPR